MDKYWCRNIFILKLQVNRSFRVTVHFANSGLTSWKVFEKIEVDFCYHIFNLEVFKNTFRKENELRALVAFSQNLIAQDFYCDIINVLKMVKKNIRKMI